MFPTTANEKATPGQANQVAAPFLGVVTMLVSEGDRVDAGTPLAVIEAMKMEAVITAPIAGAVSRVAITNPQSVEGGDLIVVL